jgi:deazaflavin-dependent oxidoreductase (nitroreductase family)
LQTPQRPIWRIVFKYLNKYFMVPAFRCGLGSILVNPIIGYIMVLKTTGAKTKQTRYAPVNYAIINGHIYCVAGWGTATHWFANLTAHPALTVLLPGRVVHARAEQVLDPTEARRAIVNVAKNAGLTLLFDGLNPLTATPRQILAANGWMPVVRIRPTQPFVGRPTDPGGWAWILPPLLTITILLTRHKQHQSRSPLHL